MSNAKPNREALEEAQKHVEYEVGMLEQTAKMLPRSPDLSDAHDRAILESFIIHTRNLVDFLYKGKGRDRIAAEDFIDAKVWREQRPNESKLIKDAYIRANNDVAHLTYTRLKNSKRGEQWPISEITKEILEAYALFEELVPSKQHLRLAISQHQPNCISTTLVSYFPGASNPAT